MTLNFRVVLWVVADENILHPYVLMLSFVDLVKLISHKVRLDKMQMHRGSG